MSSTVREWCEDTKDDWRESDAVDMKSEMSGRVLSGGTNTVEREPLLETLLRLSTERDGPNRSGGRTSNGG